MTAIRSLADEKDPQFAYTLARGMAVLRAFEGTAPELGNREIAERIGIARPTVARLTRTLEMLGYLRYDSARSRYRLGVGLLTLAYPLLAQLTIRQVARPLMQRLANLAHGSVSLATDQRPDMVLIESCVGPQAVTRPDIGATRDMLTTAMGCAYLGGITDAEREALLAQLLADRAGTAKTKAALLVPVRAELARQQKSGFCVMSSALNSVLAVGAPVHMPNGSVMALNCVVASHSADQGRMEQDLGPRLVSLARDLEKLMGTAS